MPRAVWLGEPSGDVESSPRPEVSRSVLFSGVFELLY